MEAGARVQFIGQRLDARLEPRRALGRFLGAFGCLNAALAGEAERHEIGDAPRDQHVVLREESDGLREEAEPRDHLAFETNRNA
jgi:hypothetical protein